MSSASILHSSNSTLVEDVFKFLKHGKTVVIDLSLKDTMDASIISTIFVRKLFENNKANFTSDNPEDVVDAVVFVEEAQNVLLIDEGEIPSQPSEIIMSLRGTQGWKPEKIIVNPNDLSSDINDEIRNLVELSRTIDRKIKLAKSFG